MPSLGYLVIIFKILGLCRFIPTLKPRCIVIKWICLHCIKEKIRIVCFCILHIA